jgi:hypothetical protein
MPPLAVSVGPDGLHAAVGHDGWISYVDLKAASVTTVFQIVSDVNTILLAGNGYIYDFPQRAWSDIYSLQIASGTVTGTSAIYDGRIPRLEPNGNYFYLGDASWFSKWDITKGVASILEDLGQSVCGNYWLYQDGSQLINTCGKIYATSDVPSLDYKYTGSFANASPPTWAANSSILQTTAVIPEATSNGYNTTPQTDTQIQFYGEAYFGYAGSPSLPQFNVAGAEYAAHGVFSFWNSPATSLFAIVAADPTAKLASGNAVYVVTPASPAAGCTVALNGAISTAAAAGGFGGAGVSASSNCAWSATSSAPWLTISSGTFGAGSGDISWSVASNPNAGNRTGTITLNGQAYPITQLGAAAIPLTLSAPSLSFTASWGSASPSAQTVSVTEGNSAFTASAGASWITVTPAAGSLRLRSRSTRLV